MLAFKKSTLGTVTQSRTALAVVAATLVFGGKSPRRQPNPGIITTTTTTSIATISIITTPATPLTANPDLPG